MSDDKHFENDPERTLITLEQLSQTIEVMTSVVNRLRQHLSEQLHAQMEEQQEQKKIEATQQKNSLHNTVPVNAETAPKAVDETLEKSVDAANKTDKKKQSFVVEIRQQDNNLVRKNGKTLH
ncbi:MAG: hypothetical protein AB8B95_09615 [Pseudohongiellaceae bacterium]